MKTIYSVRDENSVLKFNLSERLALSILSNTKGTWSSAKYEDGPIQRYTLSESQAVRISQGGGSDDWVDLALWKNDRIEILKK